MDLARDVQDAIRLAVRSLRDDAMGMRWSAQNAPNGDERALERARDLDQAADTLDEFLTGGGYPRLP